MARFKDAEAILAAAAQWKSRCLLGGGSLFTERRLWTRENFGELRRVYVEPVGEESSRSGSFAKRLEELLAPASADAKRLWAEMAWVYHLASTGRADPKLSDIRRFWGWSGRDLPEDHALLSRGVLAKGVAMVGVAYRTLAWMEYRFFAAAMLKWFEEDEERRGHLSNHPWKFASWLDATPFNNARQLRHALLFLLFPDDFESVFSWLAKSKIIKGLGKADRLASWDRIDLDRCLVGIRRELEREHPDQEVHFYRSPFREMWKKSKRKKRHESADDDPMTDGDPTSEEDPAADAYTLDQACKDLFISRDDFESILASIRHRKNLILQGPPGTGKTFIARRIAWSIIGREDSEPVEMVQFHQSYAYEDFVQGYRPTEKGGFRLRDGVFHRFCRRARKNPKTPHVFIIDEINRGNLSRILGELLMLIEADKRSERHAVALAYSDVPFYVPPNVHILGMMNTADRSLALVDYALRRRFAFVTLTPAFGRDEFREHLLQQEGVEPGVVDVIVKGMRNLNDKIRDDRELGPGFEIGHSYFVPRRGEETSEVWRDRIVKTEIVPLLQQYWFDSPEKVKDALRLFDIE